MITRFIIFNSALKKTAFPIGWLNTIQFVWLIPKLTDWLINSMISLYHHITYIITDENMYSLYANTDSHEHPRYRRHRHRSRGKRLLRRRHRRTSSFLLKEPCVHVYIYMSNTMATLGSARGYTNWHTAVGRFRGDVHGRTRDRQRRWASNGEILFIRRKKENGRDIRASFMAKSMGWKRISSSKCN